MVREVDVLDLLSRKGSDEQVLRLAVSRGMLTLDALQDAADHLTAGDDPVVTAAALLCAVVDAGDLASADVDSLRSELRAEDETSKAGRTTTTMASAKKLPPTPPPPTPEELGEILEVDPFEVLPLKDWDRYELVDFLGRGGMGDVFKARDPRLDRLVAIKILRRDDPYVLARFSREAQVQARIDHDNVCPVYEVGEVQGRHYIAMQYVAGGSLKEISDLLSVHEKAAIMVDVADALHAAHRIGLVHRDIKPANIMVERDADGSWRPYVVDFGIARDIDSRDLTASGAVLGTPAFAAPEQVRGETKTLDGRTDVYSLGATFYWFLTNRAPFEGGYPEILTGVTQEEPPPPHRFNREVPVDLETIILKCIEKEPDRRYDSARAVSEDLRRFLDGEPIEARRASIFYRLGKKIRKNRALAGAIGIAVLSLVLLAGVTIRSGLIAAKRNALTQRLVEEVKEMEGIMRTASMMPLHDRSKERSMIEERMHRIEEEMHRLGTLALGPGHYALGRGQLALQEYTAAADHLQTAWDQGYREPEVSYALGLALGKTYETRRLYAQTIENKELREDLIKTFEKELRDPALEHLRESAALRREAPTYVEGLIAYYENDYETALAKARAAVEQVEWLYEAKQLEGDILVVQGDEQAKRGELPRALALYRHAGAAYERAMNLARSDAEVYEGDCVRWMKTMDTLVRGGEPADMAFAQAQSSCERSIRVDSRRAAVYEKVAELSRKWADHLNDRGGDPRELLEAAAAAATRAIELDPESFTAFQALGSIQTDSALHASNSGADPRPGLDSAATSLRTAIQLRPTFVAAHDDLGYALERTARYELANGIDPSHSLEQAIASYRRAIALSPGYANPHNNMGIALWRRAVYETRVGKDPRPSLDEAIAAFQRALEINRNYAYAHANLGLAHRTRALYLLELDQDPMASLTNARNSLERGAHIKPDTYWVYPEMAAASLMAARWEMRQGRSPEAHLGAASDAVQRALVVNRTNAVAYQTAAELHRWRARWLLSSGKGVYSEVEAGLQMAERALELRPGMARALLTKGALLLIQAESETAASRRALATNAARTLEQARTASPLLERELAPLTTRARELANPD